MARSAIARGQPCHKHHAQEGMAETQTTEETRDRKTDKDIFSLAMSKEQLLDSIITGVEVKIQDNTRLINNLRKLK